MGNGDAGERAQEVFAEFVAQHAAQHAAELESLVARHPALEPALRRLYAAWVDPQQTRTTGLGALREELASRYGEGVDPGVTLDAEQRAGDDASSELVRLLSQSRPARSRYRFIGEVARGGMGAILRVWDEDLRRQLAMKVVLGRGGESSGAPALEPKSVARFLEEAQVTGQLDHPGVVPVHELGLDSQGRVYFTMRLVKGRHLGEIFQLVKQEQEGWSESRALGVLLKVCEAMAYAHSKGVIHRDLKPANVMVGRFGEAYVMDWGLARVRGSADRRDVRVRVATSSEGLLSVRKDAAAQTPGSPLVTMDGDVVGTPAYMSPEQARGDLAAMGPHSDVYAMGAILYELLAGHMPYAPPGASVNAYAIWGMVQNGPPRRLQEVAPGASAELVAICEHAMEREPRERYADMGELAADLAAFLEGRVVHAYQTGALAEFKKWVGRNKGQAVATSTALFAVLLGLAGVGGVAAVKNAQLADKNVELAVAYALEKRGREDESRARDRTEHQSYLANLSAAGSTLELGERGEARARLSACVEELRGWEWHQLTRAVEGEDLRVLTGHVGAVLDLALAPDGARVASVGADGLPRLWELSSGVVRALAGEHTQVVCAVAFSPDGALVATAGGGVRAKFKDGDIRLWRPSYGTLVDVLAGPARLDPLSEVVVNDLAFAPDGTLAAACRHFPKALAADGSVRRTGDDEHLIRLFDVRSGEYRELRGFGDQVLALAFQPRAEPARLAVGCKDRSLVVLELEGSGARTALTLRGHGDQVGGLAFDAHGRFLASACGDGVVRVFDAQSGEELRRFEPGAGAARAVAFGPDGGRIAAGFDDGRVRVFEIDGHARATTLVGHAGAVRAVGFTPDGARVVSCSDDASVRVWEAPPERELPLLAALARGPIAFSSDGALVATGSENGRVCVWDASSGAPRFVLQARVGGPPTRVSALAFTPDARSLWVARASQSERSLLRFDLASGEVEARLGDHQGGVLLAAASPDGARVAGADARGAYLFDTASARSLAVLSTLGPVDALAFSPGGELVATVGRGDGAVRLFDAASGAPLRVLAGAAARALAFSPDGAHLVAGAPLGATEHLIPVWEVESGKAVGFFSGHEGAVTALCFAPDGARLVSGSDGSVRVWSFHERSLLAVLSGLTPGPCSVAFDPSGARLFAASALDPASERDEIGGAWREWDARPAREAFAARRVGQAELRAVWTHLAPLAREALSTAGIEASLARDPSYSGRQRELALALARLVGENGADELEIESWKIARRAGERRERYEEALRRAELVRTLEPARRSLVGTLATAQYRCGRSAEALVTLAPVLERGATLEELALAGLARARLGQRDEAQAAVAALRERLAEPAVELGPDARELVRELAQFLPSAAEIAGDAGLE